MAKSLQKFSVRSAEDSYLVEAEAVRIGADVLVYIWGGDSPHIGSVAAAQPRPSLADPAQTSATASVLSYVGHKDDAVAKNIAEMLAASLETNVVVTAGIHWDNLSPDGIDKIVLHCHEIGESLRVALCANK
ncbi:MAG: hypothetical protein HQ514_13275 [Rhodospirillales bacterium]|nr:hypothetical protein [Rhodospirillales bacterium]